MIVSVKAFSDAAITCIYPGIKVRLKLITIQDITNISALNCDSILGCSSSSLFLLYRIFSKSNLLRDADVTLDLEVTVFIARGAPLTMSFFGSRHCWFFIAIQLYIGLQMITESSAHFYISAWNRCSTEIVAISHVRRSNSWNIRSSQISSATRAS